MRQHWQELLFLHWEVEPAALQALLPPDLTLDTFEGRAYVGLVPFTMRNIRPVWSPPVPWLSHFHETNVRTYVHKDGEGPGVWFFSLDAANPVAVCLARTLWKLPYHHAKMRLSIDDTGARRYFTERHEKPSVGARLSWRPEGDPSPAAPGTLAHFLCERYLLYAYDGRELRSGQVHHTPYPLQRARLLHLENTLVAEAGIPVNGSPPLIHYAAGVNVEVFGLHTLPGTKAP
jgi:uncharacterized protein YqjF (DUF2071 family)